MSEKMDLYKAYEKTLFNSYNQAGIVCFQSNLFDDSVEYFTKALALDHEQAGIIYNRGTAFQDSGNLDAAIDDYTRAIELSGDFVLAYWMRGLSHLAKGDYQAGWEDIAKRYLKEDFLTLGQERQPQARWKGEDISDKTLLVCYEQGYGDTIQLLRYIEQIKSLCKKLIIYVLPPLQPLVRSSFPDVYVPSSTAEIGEFDCYCSVMCLPRILKRNPADDPPQLPYLRVEPELQKKWSEATGFNAGLVWAGRAEHRHDSARSIPLDYFQGLLNVPGISWYALQVERGENIVDYPQMTSLFVALKDFAVTAAVILALDVVITVDTAVAHLAGALGKPVWVLKSTIPDYRCNDVWYPSMRVFQQNVPLYWGDVFDEVETELRKLVTAKVGSNGTEPA